MLLVLDNKAYKYNQIDRVLLVFNMNFKLRENEEFRVSINDVIVFANDNRFVLTVFLTDKRLVLLQDINKQLDFNKFLNARGVDIPSDLEIIEEINLSDIAELKYFDGFNHITLKNSENILRLKCDDLSKYLD